MDQVVGDIARAAAAAPMPEKDRKDKKAKNAILAVLGTPSFVMGTGKQYPRETGWGKKKTPHPDGGTNETVAFVVFRPYGADGPTQEGAIYAETFQKENGVDLPKPKRRYSISLPFLKAGRTDAKARDLIEATKLEVRTAYRAWVSNPENLKAAAERKAKADNPTEWVEESE